MCVPFRYALLAAASVLVACPPLLTEPDASVSDAGVTEPPADGGFDAGFDAGLPADAGTPREHCLTHWTLRCTAEAACEFTAPFFPTRYASVGACIAAQTARCEALFTDPLATAGLSESTSVRLLRFQACTAALQPRSSCDVTFAYPGSNTSLVPECEPRLGTLPTGAGCASDEQCAGGLCALDGGCGTCRARSARGEACTTATDCAVGLTCRRNFCGPFIAEGQGCAGEQDCQPGLRCVGGTCQAPTLPQGAGCNPSRDLCRLGSCLRQPSGNVCQVFAVDAGPGARCSRTQVPVMKTCVGSACSPLYDLPEGACASKVGLGDRCFLPDQCEEPFACMGGVCGRPGLEPTCSQDGGPRATRRDAGYPVLNDDAGFAAADEQLELVCDALLTCERWRTTMLADFTSPADCRAGLRTFFEEIANDPLDPESLRREAACNAVYRAASPCERADLFSGAKPRPYVCRARGTLAAGSVCASIATQCRDGTACSVRQLSPACGVCFTSSALGERCTYTAECVDGLLCRGGVCATEADAGTACLDDTVCTSALRCIGGRCAEPLEIDAGCARDAECAGGLHCSAAQARCVPARLASVDAGLVDGGVSLDGGLLGVRCGLRGGERVLCPKPYVCRVSNAIAQTGACEPQSALGQPCWAAGGYLRASHCGFNAFCNDDGVCARLEQSTAECR